MTVIDAALSTAGGEGAGHHDPTANPALWRLLGAASDTQAFTTAWVSLLCGQIELYLAPRLHQGPCVVHGFVALSAADAGAFTRTGKFGDGEATVMLAKLAERALTLRRPMIQKAQGETGLCQIVSPITVENRLMGVVGLELTAAAAAHLDTVMRFIQWGLAWFSRMNQSTAIDEETVQARDLLDLIRDGGSLEAVAEMACDLLMRAARCARVSLGHTAGVRIRLEASSAGQLSAHGNDFTAAIQAAQEEAAAQAAAVLNPPVAAEERLALGAHQRLCRAHQVDWAFSVPVTCAFPGQSPVTVVITFEGDSTAPDAAIRARWTRLCRMILPYIAARMRAERPLSTHLADMARHAWRTHLSVPTIRHRLAAAAISATLALAIFLPGDYDIDAHASLEGMVKRAVVAPFDGYVADAIARPGDAVAAGAVLGRLDDRDLTLQRLDLESHISEVQRQIDQAMGLRDIANVNILSARLEQYVADRELVDGNLKRVSLTAPFDAVVVSGDPSHSIGAPVRRGDVIYEVSPLDSYRVVLNVPQADLAGIRIGQDATVRLSSLPFDEWPVRVDRITPVVSVHDGVTAFRVEASLLVHAADLRPGMEGVAKVHAGRRNMLWILLHEPLGWLRLKVWEWLP